MTLEARALTLARGNMTLVRELTLAVGPGGILHVQGPNGRGKTTLLRTLAGLTQPESGRINWRGRSIGADGGSDYRGALLFLGHQPALKGALTAAENLEHYRALRAQPGLPVREALDAFAMGGAGDIPCRRLSAGQRQRVALARLLSEPAALWILDEPFTALDRSASADLARQLQRHAAAGGMTVITSHHPLPLPGRALAVLELGDG